MTIGKSKTFSDRLLGLNIHLKKVEERLAEAQNNGVCDDERALIESERFCVEAEKNKFLASNLSLFGIL